MLSALENVEYVLLLQEVGKEERTARSMEIFKEVNLDSMIHRRPHELSGGQQQRIAIARAIVSKPEIVLADDPTANLDQATGANLPDLMQSLNKNQGLTLLFSSHDNMMTERAFRLIKLSDGVIVSDIIKNKTSDDWRKFGFIRNPPD